MMTMSDESTRSTLTGRDVVAGRDLSGTEAIVTGGYSGIGAETAQALASVGARVVIVGRDPHKGEETARRIRATTGNDLVVFRQLDLNSLTEVRHWANRHATTGKPLHYLINNAGVMANPLQRTADGLELQFGINHVAHHVLTVGLLPNLRIAAATGGARVVQLTSSAHRRSRVDFDDPNFLQRPYDPWQAYGQSKTASSLFTVGFTARYGAEGIVANAVMPGAIHTALQRHMSQDELQTRGWINTDASQGWKSPEQGAATSIWAAIAPELDGIGGKYLEDCAIAEPWKGDADALPRGQYLPYALDRDDAERLWRLTENIS
jgi:NAD(P)-dependent dehydrogenase (short-subunit alcohol dehydrogenase family)